MLSTPEEGFQRARESRIAVANLTTAHGKNKGRLKRSVVSHVFCAVSTDYTEKNIFLPIFGADLAPSQTRSGIMIDTTCRRRLGPAVAQVSAASGAGGSGERHRWVQWMVQVGAVDGAGQ